MTTYDLYEEQETKYPWMPLFISLMMVLLTIFIFLTTYIRGNRLKAQQFREQFRESLMLPGLGGKGAHTISDAGIPDDPLQSLVNRMKSSGINKKLMDEFLTLNQIKELVVKDGKRGIAVIMPEVVSFIPDQIELTDKAKTYLTGIAFLAVELPYLVEIRGYSTSNVPAGFVDALEFSSRRAFQVYQFLLNQEIPAVKLKISGCGDAFSDSDVPQDKVEIIFKSPEL